MDLISPVNSLMKKHYGTDAYVDIVALLATTVGQSNLFTKHVLKPCAVADLLQCSDLGLYFLKRTPSPINKSTRERCTFICSHCSQSYKCEDATCTNEGCEEGFVCRNTKLEHRIMATLVGSSL